MYSDRCTVYIQADRDKICEGWETVSYRAPFSDGTGKKVWLQLRAMRSGFLNRDIRKMVYLAEDAEDILRGVLQ